MPQSDTARQRMNRMYRWTRHTYDASRKYYLLGRDTLIKNLNPDKNDQIIEIGCGTARNLRKLAKRYPDMRFHGLDASDEMLKTAQSILKHHKVSDRVTLSQGDAQNFDAKVLFNIQGGADKLIFSYSLSIMPVWKEALNHALKVLKSDGEIHIVDFGGQDGLPKWFRSFLFWWLELFHVYHKPEILEHLRSLESQGKGSLKITPLFKGYAYYAVFIKT